jgi:3-isopropylmalate dehydrogenase
MTKKILLLAGDGIGPEVTAISNIVLEFLTENGYFAVSISEADFGGVSIDRHGVPLTDDALALALNSDAVLMGAVGGPKWVNESYDNRPEAGLLKLRTEMDVYANLRPAFCFDSLIDASTLKPEFIKGLDILFVRELTAGIYFGQPRGVQDLSDGSKLGVNTHTYTSAQIRRAARYAFEIARVRKNRVCSVEKGNVMEAGLLWREEVAALHVAEYADVELTHMLADNCAMQLVKNPLQFDIILTDNLFGDLLSDQAAMLTGSIGMLPSAALGATGKPGLYEPIHGSAPDIAGQNKANPCASVLSLAMAFRYSFDRVDIADAIEAAVEETLAAGVLTADLGGDASTDAMGQSILASIVEHLR